MNVEFYYWNWKNEVELDCVVECRVCESVRVDGLAFARCIVGGRVVGGKVEG